MSDTNMRYAATCCYAVCGTCIRGAATSRAVLTSAVLRYARYAERGTTERIMLCDRRYAMSETEMLRGVEY
eukprot:3932797-Rhodomonas_salina.2